MSPLPEVYTGLSQLAAHIGESDVRLGNLEMVLSNYDCYASTFCGGTWLTAPTAILDSLCSCGFNCFSVANNHSMDYSYGGLMSTLEALDAYSLPYCGAGMSLADAAAPAYIHTKHGTAAVLSVTATCDDAARAGDAGPAIPARPGVNMLRHSEIFYVNHAHMQAIREVAAATMINGRIENSKRGGYTPEKPGIISLGPIDFSQREVEGKMSIPNSVDMSRILASIRAARQLSDCVIVCFHSHEIKGATDDEPDHFIETFCHGCIDAGADAMIGSGTHQIKAVELYRNKPIFYSIANFIFQSDDVQQLPADFYEKYRVREDKTAAEALAVRSAKRNARTANR